MKYILYFTVLLFSSINLSSAAQIHGHLDTFDVDTYKINVTDAENFSVEMTGHMSNEKGPIDDAEAEASVWLFKAPSGKLSWDDQFWSNDFPSIFPGDFSDGDEGMYYLAFSIFGIEPATDNIHDGWLTDAANDEDYGDYWVEITGASVPAPPVLWLLSAGLLVLVRQRKKFS